MRKRKFEKFLQKLSSIVILLIIVFIFISLKSSHTALGDIIFYDIIPFYSINNEIQAFKQENEYFVTRNKTKDDNEQQINDVELIGIDDVDFEEKAFNQTISNSDIDLSKLNNLDYLRQKFYTVDKKTNLTSDYFNVSKFLNTNLHIDKSLNEPKVLIFHTHSKEMFSDSKANDINEGIVGAGARLANLLEEKYGIKTIHIKDSFDVVNGSTKISGAYERMEPRIRKVLQDNPSIELVIDLHRDGVNENTRLVKEINGKPTAQIMYFNGISRINQNGVLSNISNLPNPNVETNLALSFNMQKRTMEKYPEFARKIYVNAYRYSLHMKPKSMLIEVGAQTNTKQEIYNAIDLLAELIDEVIFQ